MVVKFGGSVFEPPALAGFARRIRELVASGRRVVVVHGGGKEITALLQRLGHAATFLDGLRVTDDDALEASELVLSGRVNKTLARVLESHGVASVGVAGTDGGLLVSRVVDARHGHVGGSPAVNPRLLQTLLEAGYTPVVSPLASGGTAGVLNVNADTAAAAIAAALRADSFVLLSDVPGVLVPASDGQRVAPTLTVGDAALLRSQGVIHGGMIPKIDACLAALAGGASSARIAAADAFASGHDGAGTLIEGV